MNTQEILEAHIPKVFVAKELREISRDFTRPEEMIREAIANSLDAKASKIRIHSSIDTTYGDEDLIVEIEDDGVGMNLEELKGFFDLGRSSKRNDVDKIGEKGHGTKIFYNSKEVIVYTKFLEDGNILKATLRDPFAQLNASINRGIDEPPSILIEKLEHANNYLDEVISGTYIIVKGYDKNNTATFKHEYLKDYIQWFTAWGSIKAKLKDDFLPDCELLLKGFGKEEFEPIPYGHSFPKECYNFTELRKIDDRRPENHYVRSWKETATVIDYPQHKIEVLFYVEGDSAKRNHNEMLKWPGRPKPGRYHGEDQYTVSDRYGIYLYKDYIPVQRKNERFAERSEWTKWHAFINCQGFELTANRATVDNTNKKLLESILITAEKIIQKIIDTDEYQDFADRVRAEIGRRKAENERKSVTRRIKKSKGKTTYQISKNGKELNFIEPGSEQGVIWLTAQILALWPDTFRWELADLNSHFGYDMLIKEIHSLTNTTDHRFVEFKFQLRDEEDFNHSLSFLHQIICWDCKLSDDAEITDIQKKTFKFKSYQADNDLPYRRFYLDDGRPYKIEIIILEKFLEDKFNLKKL
ncbi:ATP-binding protein [Bacillus paralicheniformis]|uniref:ATP-binding protein n=1 Tax=Bacillus paralicheniformis TaxID=1648923 RepID=UPI00208E97AF|nr:ATP-binding protein [Bacillus paralicheniformis]